RGATAERARERNQVNAAPEPEAVVRDARPMVDTEPNFADRVELERIAVQVSGVHPIATAQGLQPRFIEPAGAVRFRRSDETPAGERRDVRADLGTLASLEGRKRGRVRVVAEHVRDRFE